jgi:hypothetical protein
MLMLSPLALLAGCSDDSEPPLQTDMSPLRFDYLKPLRLNVASIDIEDRAPPVQQAPSPTSPAQALRQMAEDRLSAGGGSGRAVFVIDQATIIPASGGLDGVLAVHLDVLTGEGRRAGFAEARVARRATGREARGGDAAYRLLRQMMADMNVELEYQVGRSLHDWLQVTSEAAPAPASVQQQDLGTPRRP